jgi:hypothetical protein
MDCLEPVTFQTLKKRLCNYRVVFDEEYLHTVMLSDVWLGPLN